MDFEEVNNVNDRIEKIVKSLPENHYASNEEISFYKRYSKCDDFILSDKLIKDIWDWFRGEIILLKGINNCQVLLVFYTPIVGQERF